MNVKPIDRSQNKQGQQQKAENFVPMGEWVSVLQINPYLHKHLINNPEKIHFGIGEGDILCIMIDK